MSESSPHHAASYTYLTDHDWDQRIEELQVHLHSCRLCPRECAVDRSAGKPGFCRAPGHMVLSSIFPHHGEEPPISGTAGSGTVFFSHCTLRCAFCQNYQISHEHEGVEYQVAELARRMVELQELGCHNVNLVTATHFLPLVIPAIREAARQGLRIPVVYNCGGYERPQIMSLLSGIVDIYLPDMKYGSSEAASRYSQAPDYVEVNHATIKEMFRQVGPLRVDDNGVAYRGLCIRHLVLPGGQSNPGKILEFLAATFDPSDIFISLMAQYRPLYQARNFPEINDMVEPEHYVQVKERFLREGFEGFYQEMSELDRAFLIDFRKRKHEALTGGSIDWKE